MAEKPKKRDNKKVTYFSKYVVEPVVNIEDGVELPRESYFHYNIVEYVGGSSFVVDYDKTERSFSVSPVEKEGAKEDEFLAIDASINVKNFFLYKPFRDLADKLGRSSVSFKVFIEYINKKNQKIDYITGKDEGFVIVNDIYINSNWIRHKDLYNICMECGLEVMPPLYEGVYDEKIINIYANEVSSSFNDNIRNYGIFIKPIFEDEEKGKRVIELRINDKYSKAFREAKERRKEKQLALIVHKEAIEEDEIRKQVDHFLTNSLTDVRKNVADKVLEYNFPNFKKNKNLKVKDILTFAVNSVKTSYLREFEYYNKADGDLKKKVEKRLNSSLSSFFIRRYNLMGRR